MNVRVTLMESNKQRGIEIEKLWVEKIEWNSQFRSDQSNQEKWSTLESGPVF